MNEPKPKCVLKYNSINLRSWVVQVEYVDGTRGPRKLRKNNREAGRTAGRMAAVLGVRVMAAGEGLIT